MAGNSSRRGAVRKSGKGNPTAGSGGRRRRALEGKGPTPKAKDRPGHVAHKRTAKAEKTASARPRRNSTGAGQETEWIAGRNSVVEALRAQMPVSTVYVAEGAERDGRLREAFAACADRGIPLLEVSRAELDRLTRRAVHQGLAAKVPPYSYAHPGDLLDAASGSGAPPLIVALDSVTDPRNLGAVVRSAAGFGAHGVLIPERRSAGMTASAWKTSAGAAARVPVARATNLVRQLKAYQDAGCMVIGLDASGDVPLPSLELADGPLVIVVGSEGKGLSRLVAETCDALVSIPMATAAGRPAAGADAGAAAGSSAGSIESLNAGVAASIALYAVATRRSA